MAEKLASLSDEDLEDLHAKIGREGFAAQQATRKKLGAIKREQTRRHKAAERKRLQAELDALDGKAAPAPTEEGTE